MPTFNFTIETKPERKPKSNINKTVKLTKVEGIVNITIDGIYKVKVNKFIYDGAISSFSVITPFKNSKLLFYKCST